MTSMPRRLAAGRSALLLLVAMAALAACGSSGAAAATSAPRTAAPTAIPSPNATAGPTDPPAAEAPAKDGCVATDTEIGVATTLERFEAVPCTAADARYRVLLVTGADVLCPAGTEFTVTRIAAVYCLTSELVDDPTKVTAQDVAEDDCLAVAGGISVDEIRRYACDDPLAQYRVLAVLDRIDHAACPAAADQYLDSFDIPVRVLCLASIEQE